MLSKQVRASLWVSRASRTIVDMPTSVCCPHSPAARAIVGVGFVLGLALAPLGCSSSTPAATTAGTGAPGATDRGAATPGIPGDGTTIAPVAREILGQIEAPMAPGYTQYLLKVTIQPGATLPKHHHPGIEVARIVEGELTYKIDSGTADIGRNGSGTPTEQATGPTTVVLRAGDTVYENPTLEHDVVNSGKVPVVVSLAALIEDGQPIAIND